MATKADRAGVAKQVLNGRGELAALSSAILLASLGSSIANVALPTLGAAFGATLAQLEWVALSYMLAVTGGCYWRAGWATGWGIAACCWQDWRCSLSRLLFALPRPPCRC